jgi:hypothetical protein
MRIGSLVQKFMSKNFGIQNKENLVFKQRILGQGELNSIRDFEFKGRLEYFQRRKI